VREREKERYGWITAEGLKLEQCLSVKQCVSILGNRNPFYIILSHHNIIILNIYLFLGDAGGW
jgi:hypothetical protein